MGPKMMKPTSTNAHSAGIFADMTVDGPIIGDLVVVIDRARNLPNLKTMGKQDPYCAARLGKEAKKTDTDRRGGQTPKWDQELRFVVHDSPDYYRLKVSVFNDDRKTDLIGETWIDLKTVIVRGGGQHDGWHGLNCKGRSCGELRMEITYYDTREREEKYVEEKVPRQTKEVESSSSSRNGNLKRRPLPQGPVSQRASMPPASSTPLTTKKIAADAKLPRHMSTDATEDGPVDPYEHRHKMMMAHGLPFDPTASRKRELRSYNGGPRPAPGQKGFSDLEKLSYRNRGLQLPESPPQNLRSQDQQRPRQLPAQPSTFYHEPATINHDTNQSPLEASGSARMDNDALVDESAIESIAHSLEANLGSQPYHQQLQTSFQSDHVANTYSLPDIQEATRFPPQNFSSQPYYPREQGMYMSHESNSHQYSLVDEVNFAGEEGLPPPPPPHRSSHSGAEHPMLSEKPQQNPSVHSSFADNLSKLDGNDEFCRPMESMTQLTTQSEPSPLTDLRHPNPGYDRSHYPVNGPGQGSFDTPQNRHRMSMQDMRDYSRETHQINSPVWLLEHEAQRHGDFERNPGRHEAMRYASPPRPNYYQEQMPLHSGLGQSTELAQQSSQQMVLANPHENMYGTDYNESPHHLPPSDHFQGQFSHRSSAPLIKPRAVSPNVSPQTHQSVEPGNTQPRSSITRKSVSPAPSPRRPESPRLSGVAFSPDSFDVLNPQISAVRSSASANESDMIIPNYEATTQSDSDPVARRSRSNSHIPSPQVEDAVDPDAPIRDSNGRLIDPSDHLPSSTWAPEPETKRPSKKPEVKLRFRGAVPMPVAAPRARRPSVELPELRSSVQSAFLTETPSPTDDGKEKPGRNKLQKRVRVMMTGGARKNEKIDRKMDQRAENGNTLPLRDIPNVNGNTGSRTESTREARNREVYGRSYAPKVPAKVPLETGHEENRIDTLSSENNAMDALSKEIGSIDIGTGNGGRLRKTRFATTLM